jgi:hypothetical protein
VKRVDLVRHLAEHGCELLREGASHSFFVRRAAPQEFVSDIGNAGEVIPGDELRCPAELFDLPA